MDYCYVIQKYGPSSRIKSLCLKLNIENSLYNENKL